MKEAEELAQDCTAKAAPRQAGGASPCLPREVDVPSSRLRGVPAQGTTFLVCGLG